MIIYSVISVRILHQNLQPQQRRLQANSTFKKKRFVTPSRRGKELAFVGSCWEVSCAKAGSWMVKYGLKSAEYGSGVMSATSAATAAEHTPAWQSPTPA